MTDKPIDDLIGLEEGLKAAIRAAKLALFVIKKQNVMPNSSWADGFEKDLTIAIRSLAPLSESSEHDNDTE